MTPSQRRLPNHRPYTPSVPAPATTASIVIDNYNYGRFLRQCIDSALAQTVSAQVIVVDDGSTDDSVKIVHSYGEQVLLVAFSENRGQAAALNAGFAAATGDVVLLLDSDDWIVPNRVERVLEAFASDVEVRAVRHDMSAVDVDGRRLSDRLYGFPAVSEPADDVLRFGRTPGSTGCMAFRRSFLRDLGPIPDECFYRGPDYYLIVGAALLGELWTISESLTVRRFHPAQITSRFATERSLVPATLERGYCQAMSVSDLAKRHGRPQELISSSTWWQQKAIYERNKAKGHDWPWFRAWLRHLALTLRAPIPLARRVGELGRSVALGLLPGRLFLHTWWRTHMGRPRLRPIDALSTRRLTTKRIETPQNPNGQAL